MPLQAQFLDEGKPFVLHVTLAVNVKFRGWKPDKHLGKRTDGNIEPLVMLQATGEYHDESVVLTCSGAREKNRPINVVQDDRAPVRRDGAVRNLLQPEVIGDDDIVSESAGRALNL